MNTHQLSIDLSLPTPPTPKYRWGADGVGRGNCAGLNIWAVVGVPCGVDLPGVCDSKLTKSHHRKKLIEAIRKKCVISLGVATPVEIDILGINQAEAIALNRAIQFAYCQGHFPENVIGDLAMPSVSVSSRREKSADAIHVECSAASIAAKYALDSYWGGVHKYYPQYKFTKSAGYATTHHKSAMQTYGLIDRIHRKTYKPCQAIDRNPIIPF